jgi:A/G-specific adenine glycosylase
MVVAAAHGLLPPRAARSHNLALMDLGATVCSARDPACHRCPLRARCEWRSLGSPAAVGPPKPAQRFEETSRFARGRIVDALRSASSLTAGEIEAELPAIHAGKLHAYLVALEHDGMISRNGDRWSLPGGAATA